MDRRKFKLEPPIPLASALKLTLGMVTMSLILFLKWQHNPILAEEDHLMEWMQASFLGLACISHFRRSRLQGPDPVGKAVFIGLSLLSISFVARELDIDSWGNPAIAEPVQTVFRVTLIILWIVFARYLLKHFATLWRALPVTLGKPVVTLAFIGACFYLVSWPFEKELFPMSESAMMFGGQLVQIYACMLLFGSSLATLFHPDPMTADNSLAEHSPASVR